MRPGPLLLIPLIAIGIYLAVPTESWLRLGRRAGLESPAPAPVAAGEQLGSAGAEGIEAQHQAFDQRGDNSGRMTAAEVLAALDPKNPPVVRMGAVARAGEMSDDDARRVVAAALKDPFPGVRRQGMLRLGVPPRVRLESLGVSLAEDPVPELRSRWEWAVKDQARR